MNTETMNASRRRLLKYTAGAFAALALPARAQPPAAPVMLAPGLALLNVGGANVLALASGAGLVLVDSGAPGHADALQAGLAALDAGPATLLFNTHWHSEQTGANAEQGAAGATIVAHEKTRQRLAIDYYIPHEERFQRSLEKSGQPVRTFFHTDTFAAGAEQIDCGYLQLAHTDGDIYVHFRNANVLAVGDVASPERDPAIDWYGGGWTGGRVDAMDRLLALADDATQIVPAFGPVMTRAQMQTERDMLGFLHERLTVLVREGKSARDSLDTGLMEGLGRTWHDPYKFLYDAHKGLWAHHSKIGPNVL